MRRTWSTPLDPMIRKPTKALMNSRAVIDACRPFEWIDEFPKVVQVGGPAKESLSKGRAEPSLLFLPFPYKGRGRG